MENLRVLVKTEAEIKEAQELFFDLGASWCFGKELNNNLPRDLMFILHNDGSCLYWADAIDCNVISSTKEVTLPELRDLVVLKRNDVVDATHIGRSGSEYYLGNKSYFWDGVKWDQRDFSDLVVLKPIEKKEMKEYLIKDPETNFYYVSSSREHGFVAEVPEGAEVLKHFYGDSGLCFYRNKFSEIWQDKINPPYWGKVSDIWVDGIIKGGELLWQRENINDKVASGESYSSMSQTTFIERELCKSSLNHIVANAFRAIRSDMVRLTEDDVRLIQELTELTKAHGDVWK